MWGIKELALACLGTLQLPKDSFHFRSSANITSNSTMLDDFSTWGHDLVSVDPISQVMLQEVVSHVLISVQALQGSHLGVTFEILFVIHCLICRRPYVQSCQLKLLHLQIRFGIR